MVEQGIQLVFFFSVFQSHSYIIFRLLSGVEDFSHFVVHFCCNSYTYKDLEKKLVQELLLKDAAYFFHQIHCIRYNAVLHEKIKIFAKCCSCT